MTLFLFLFWITYIGILFKYVWSIRSTKSFIRGISSATIDVNLPHFDLLYVGEYKNYYLPFGRGFWCRISKKYLRIIVSVPSIFGRKEICITLIFYITLEYWRNTHFILTHLKFRLLPPQEETVLYVRLLYLAIRIGCFRWHWSIIYRENIPLGNSPMSFISDTIFFI